MIYTSYFGKLKKFPDDLIPIAICAKCPNGYQGAVYKKLAPTYQILMDYKKAADGGWESLYWAQTKYVTRYRAQILDKLDPQQVVRELEDLAGGRDIVLLCYERPEAFCHRHLVAEWLKSHGISCEEWRE